jgi:hypothetical protein
MKKIDWTNFVLGTAVVILLCYITYLREYKGPQQAEKIYEYGWFFDWYESDEERNKEHGTTIYAKFPSDYVEVGGDHEKQIVKFLKSLGDVPECEDIHVSSFMKWLAKMDKPVNIPTNSAVTKMGW